MPDMLDEARWELEFMLKMQVPDGQPKAGMVHHKIHDEKWTAIGTAARRGPDRALPPAGRTAATLNLAATAAQARAHLEEARPAFSAKCLAAAEKAWDAAQANPATVAERRPSAAAPTTTTNVDDEFYWAAAELFITTKKDVYKTFLEKSPYFKKVPTSGEPRITAGASTGVTWRRSGTISLAVVAKRPRRGRRLASTAAIVAARPTPPGAGRAAGYRVPFKPGTKGYPWGSNSFVLNNAIVLGLAHTILRRSRKYLNGVGRRHGLHPRAQPAGSVLRDRLRRAAAQSNPHHRFWAHQASAEVPVGAARRRVGRAQLGPAGSLRQAAGLEGCAPEKCFVDNIEAWSANEVAINWNAPLAWVAAFLDDLGEKSR